MTNKIIIDGVNVAKCVFCYIDQETDQIKCGNFNYEDGYCRQYENCYFKQLQREKTTVSHQREMYKQKYRELELKYKSQSRRLKIQNAEIIDYQKKITAVYDYYKNHIQILNNTRLYLNQTLKDVRELAIKLVKDDNQPPCVYDDDCPLNSGVGFDNHCNEHCQMILGRQILEKIDEILT